MTAATLAQVHDGLYEYDDEPLDPGYVDWVLVEHALSGRATWKQLSKPERLEAVRIALTVRDWSVCCTADWLHTHPRYVKACLPALGLRLDGEARGSIPARVVKVTDQDKQAA